MNKRATLILNIGCQSAFARATVSMLLAASLFFVALNVGAATDSANNSGENSNAPKANQGYTLKKNTSLEALVKEVYAGSPLNTQVLGKALHEANPKIITGKLNQTIKRGQLISLPDHAVVITQTLTPYAQPPAASELANYGSQSNDAISRRYWVRFP
jgi:phage tail protein X